MYRENNEEGTGESLNSLNCLAIIIFMMFIMIVTNLINIKSYRDDEGRLAKAFIHQVDLDEGEQRDLEKALAAWSMKDYSKLENWIGGIKRQGKYGILPPLPVGPGSFDDTIYIKRIERLVLLPPTK